MHIFLHIYYIMWLRENYVQKKKNQQNVLEEKNNVFSGYIYQID